MDMKLIILFVLVWNYSCLATEQKHKSRSYSFSYNVFAPDSGNYHGHSQSKKEDGETIGSYYLMSPDGLWHQTKFSDKGYGYTTILSKSKEPPSEIKSYFDSSYQIPSNVLLFSDENTVEAREITHSEENGFLPKRKPEMAVSQSFVSVNFNKNPIEKSKTQRESEKTQRESEKTQRESEKTQRESEKTQRESKKTQRESKKTQRESEKTQRESEKTQRESEKTQRESKKTQRESEKTQRESEKTQRETKKTHASVETTSNSNIKTNSNHLREAVETFGAAHNSLLIPTALQFNHNRQTFLKDGMLSTVKDISDVKEEQKTSTQSAEKREKNHEKNSIENIEKLPSPAAIVDLEFDTQPQEENVQKTITKTEIKEPKFKPSELLSIVKPTDMNRIKLRKITIESRKKDTQISSFDESLEENTKETVKTENFTFPSDDQRSTEYLSILKNWDEDSSAENITREQKIESNSEEKFSSEIEKVDGESLRDRMNHKMVSLNNSSNENKDTSALRSKLASDSQKLTIRNFQRGLNSNKMRRNNFQSNISSGTRVAKNFRPNGSSLTKDEVSINVSKQRGTDNHENTYGFSVFDAKEAPKFHKAFRPSLPWNPHTTILPPRWIINNRKNIKNQNTESMFPILSSDSDTKSMSHSFNLSPDTSWIPLEYRPHQSEKNSQYKSPIYPSLSILEDLVVNKSPQQQSSGHGRSLQSRLPSSNVNKKNTNFIPSHPTLSSSEDLFRRNPYGKGFGHIANAYADIFDIALSGFHPSNPSPYVRSTLPATKSSSKHPIILDLRHNKNKNIEKNSLSSKESKSSTVRTENLNSKITSSLRTLNRNGLRSKQKMIVPLKPTLVITSESKEDLSVSMEIDLINEAPVTETSFKTTSSPTSNVLSQSKMLSSSAIKFSPEDLSTDQHVFPTSSKASNKWIPIKPDFVVNKEKVNTANASMSEDGKIQHHIVGNGIETKTYDPIIHMNKLLKTDNDTKHKVNETILQINQKEISNANNSEKNDNDKTRQIKITDKEIVRQLETTDKKKKLPKLKNSDDSELPGKVSPKISNKVVNQSKNTSSGLTKQFKIRFRKQNITDRENIFFTIGRKRQRPMPLNLRRFKSKSDNTSNQGNNSFKSKTIKPEGNIVQMIPVDLMLPTTTSEIDQALAERLKNVKLPSKEKLVLKTQEKELTFPNTRDQSVQRKTITVKDLIKVIDRKPEEYQDDHMEKPNLQIKETAEFGDSVDLAQNNPLFGLRIKNHKAQTTSEPLVQANFFALDKPKVIKNSRPATTRTTMNKSPIRKLKTVNRFHYYLLTTTKPPRNNSSSTNSTKSYEDDGRNTSQSSEDKDQLPETKNFVESELKKVGAEVMPVKGITLTIKRND